MEYAPNDFTTAKLMCPALEYATNPQNPGSTCTERTKLTDMRHFLAWWPQHWGNAFCKLWIYPLNGFLKALFLEVNYLKAQLWINQQFWYLQVLWTTLPLQQYFRGHCNTNETIRTQYNACDLVCLESISPHPHLRPGTTFGGTHVFFCRVF